MKLSLCLLVFGTLVAGPAAAQDRASLEGQLQAERKSCSDAVTAHTITTAVDYWNCANAAMRRYLVATAFPWMDLQNVNEGEHLANASNFDLHRITAQELVANDTKIDSEFTTSLNQRVAAEMQMRSAQRPLNNGGAPYTWLSQQFLNPPQPSPPVTTNCMPFGPGFQCTTQ